MIYKQPYSGSLVYLQDVRITMYGNKVDFLHADLDDQDADTILKLGRGNYRINKGGYVVAYFDLKDDVKLTMWIR